MIKSQNNEEIFHFFSSELDEYSSFSLFNKLDDDFNKNEFKLTFQENISNFNQIKNKLKKKEIKFITNKINKISNKEKKRKEKTFLNESINNNKINTSLMNIQKFNSKILSNVIYRKDAYYKHFKANLGKYIKDRMNSFKNKCFPFYSRNNFASPSYKYTGNPKEKDNLIYLSFKIKDIMIKGGDKAAFNRQYNNELIINFIEENESKAIDKNTYKELITFLNDKLEEAIIQFYDDEKEFQKIKSDPKCIYFDKFYKRETGISLLEKYGFLKALKKYK